MTFPTRLKQELKNRGMSTRELARRLGVSHTTVLRWTSGTCTPNSRFIVPLSNVFLVDPDVFLGGL